MIQITRPVNFLTIFIGLSLLCSGLALAADDNLNIVFTTTNAGGSYGNKHVHVVWITDTAGNWIHTAGTNSTNKRTLWANARASSLKTWYNSSNPNRTADIAARTGATQTAYATYNINWNWRRLDGTEVPDGTYRVHFECTNSDSGTPKNYTYLTITKGNSSQTVGPVTQGGYNNVKLVFTPGAAVTAPTIANSPASNITANSATLNGNLTATGGENPTVYIYWGTTDGGTTASAWAHSINLGTRATGLFSSNISGLTTNTNYYFRCYATNSGGSAWASSTATFKTAMPLPKISLSPTALYFPETAVKATSDLTLNIQNTGSAILTVSSLNIVGLDSDQYSLVSPPAMPFNISASSGQQIMVRFAPASPKPFYAQLTIASNDGDNPVMNVDLYGTGTAVTPILLQPSAVIGSGANAVALSASNVLLAQGASLSIFDVTNSANPVKLAGLNIGDIIQNVSVSGSVCYVAAGNLGLAVVDLSQILKPQLIANFNTDGFAYDVACSGTTLCIADGPKGLAIYNISNPQTPMYQGTYATQGSATDVVLSGTNAYVLDDQLGLQIINTSTRTLTGSLNTIEFGQALAIAGPRAYITDRMGDFFVVNASPSAPSLLSQTRLQGAPGKSIAISGIYAYVTSDLGLEIINVTNSSAPVSSGIYSAAGLATDITISSSTAYVSVADKGLSILNLSSPLAPAKLGSYEMQTAPVAAQSNNSIIYVADEKGLKVIDISKLQNPLSLSVSDTLGQPQSVALSGNTAYIANGLSGLQILNVTNPQAPTLIANFPIDGFASNVAVSGNNAMVTAGNMVYLINVTNPASPTLKASFVSNGWPGSAVISGSYGYIANGGYGFEILNLSNASSVGHFDTPGNAYGVAVSGNTAYVADGQSGLQIINVQNPALPTLISNFDTPGIAMDVKVIGQRVCLADNYGGVSVIDVSNPALPALYATSDAPLRTTSLTLSASKILAVDSRAGLVILGTQTQPTDLAGDIYTDYKINALDIRVLANNWLMQESSLNPIIGDINNDDIVNYLDFSVLAKNWLVQLIH